MAFKDSEVLMSLEDRLKTETVAAASPHVAQWVNALSHALRQHEEALTGSLEALRRASALDTAQLEEALASAVTAAVAAEPAPMAPAAPDLSRLKASMESIDRATGLSDAMTALVNESVQYIERAVMFIVKGPSAMGWYGKGANPDAVRALQAPLSADSDFAHAFNSRRPRGGSFTEAPGTAGVVGRLGGQPHDFVVVPLVLRDKVAAIFYGDSSRPIAAGDRDSLEILIQYATRAIDLMTLSRAAAPRPTASITQEQRAAAVQAASAPPLSQPLRPPVPVVTVAAPPPPPAQAPPPRPAPAAVRGEPEGASTVMFSATSISDAIQAPPSAPPAPASSGLSAEDQKAHDQAKRFARLVVSEIKLYNEAKVTEGRRHKDLYERLKEDIERGRQVYGERVPARVREGTNFFYDELVRILAGGDATALGPM